MATKLNAIQGLQNLTINIVAGESFKRSFVIYDKNNQPVSLLGASSIQWVIGTLTLNLGAEITIGGTNNEKIQVEKILNLTDDITATYMKIVFSSGYTFYAFSKSKVVQVQPDAI